MANTATVTTVRRGSQQLQGAFKEQWLVAGTITNNDAIAATAIGEFDITVNGVALGDMVLGISTTTDLDDGTDQASLSAHVSAANTVTIQVSADDAQFAADALNNGVYRILIGRPAWD